MKAGVVSVLLIGIVFASTAAGEDHPLPGGWRLIPFVAANQYRIGLDREIRHGGKSAGFLESHADWEKNHYDKLGTTPKLQQNLDATKYRGKRLRLSAFLKSKDVKERAYFAANVPKPRCRQRKLGGFNSARPGHWEGREDARNLGLQKARKVAAERISQAADEAYADILPMMKKLREDGFTLQRIADKLNADGHTTRRGAAWNQVQVKRVLDRIKS